MVEALVAAAAELLAAAELPVDGRVAGLSANVFGTAQTRSQDLRFRCPENGGGEYISLYG